MFATLSFMGYYKRRNHNFIIFELLGKYQQFISPMRAKQNKTDEMDYKFGS